MLGSAGRTPEELLVEDRLDAMAFRLAVEPAADYPVAVHHDAPELVMVIAELRDGAGGIEERPVGLAQLARIGVHLIRLSRPRGDRRSIRRPHPRANRAMSGTRRIRSLFRPA